VTINEILKLPKTLNSASIIKGLLKTEVFNYNNFFSCIKHYLNILELNNDDESILNEGNAIFNDLKNYQNYKNQDLFVINDYLFKASLRQKNKDLASTYLSNKKELLSNLNKDDLLLDVIYYNKTFALSLNNIEDNYDFNNISPKIKEEIKVELFSYYYANRNNQKALVYYNFDSIHEDNIIALLTIYYSLDKKEEFLSRISEDLRRLTLDNLASGLYLYLSYLLKIEDYHRITIVDGEYNEQFSSFSLINQKRIYGLLRRIYKKTNNKFVYNEYQKLYTQVDKLIESQIDSKNEVTPQSTILEESSDEEEELNESPSLDTPQHQSPQNEVYYEIITKIAYFINFSHVILPTTPLRENFRLLLIEVEKFIGSMEVGIYLINNQTNYYYRLGRLVDKYILKTTIKNTFVENCLNAQASITIFESELKTINNIHNQQRFDSVGNVLFVCNLEDVGVVYYLIKEDVYYKYIDFLKLLNQVLLTIVKDYFVLGQLKYASSFLEGILRSNISLRTIVNYKSTFNDKAMQLFKVTKDYHLDYFYSNTDLKIAYKDIVTKAYNELGFTSTFTYGYESMYIKETITSIMVEDDIIVISLFEDITTEYINNLLSEEERIVDLKSGLYNYNYLQEYLKDNLNKKLSLILIRLNNNISNLYSIKENEDYYFEFCGLTKKIISSYNAKGFFFSTKQLLIIMESNDQRVISSILDDYINLITTYKSITIPNEMFSINAGILRYPNQTTEKNISKLFNYLSVTLLNNGRVPNTYLYFDMSEYESYVKEELIIKELINQIDANKLEIILEPIVKLETNKITSYKAIIELLSYKVDYNTIINIAKKRHKTKFIDFFIINKVIELIKYCYNDLKAVVEIVIPLNLESIDSSFWSIIDKNQEELKNKNIIFLFNKEVPLNIINQFISKQLLYAVTSLNNIGLENAKIMFLPFNDALMTTQYLSNIIEYFTLWNLRCVITGADSALMIQKLKKFNLFVISKMIETITPEKLISLLEREISKNAKQG
jgi:hypothetical protein